MSLTDSTGSILQYVLRLYYHVEVLLDMQELKQYISNDKFQNRNAEFKKELAEAILERHISTQKFEKLTGEDFETQEEVNEFLKTEIWQPLYGDEPITMA